jgi:hypothetical protein
MTGTWKPTCQFTLALSENQGKSTADRRRVHRYGKHKGDRSQVCLVGRNLMRVRQKSSMWLVGMQLGIRNAKKAGEGQGRQERLGTDGCPESAGLVS